MAVALLLVVSAHAASPLAEPLARKAGSAFSSATADVSLKSGGQLATARVEQGIEPPRPHRTPPLSLVLAAAFPGAGIAVRPHGHAPPAAATTFAPLSPRAPPAA